MKLLCFLLLVLTLSCTTKQPQTAQVEYLAKNDKVIQFSAEQLEMAEIKMGMIQKRKLSAYVECNGTIELPPQDLVTISAPAGGIVKSVNFLAGEKVNKGDVLAILQNAEYIRLQQDYLETAGQFEYYKAEFERQGELTVENAASVKKMQQSQSDFKTFDSRKSSLRAQLILLGIDVDKLKSENISAEISLKAPISGYITVINANVGKYVNNAETIYEIANNKHMHLSLKVYEKDLTNLRTGQQINFTANAFKNKVFNAKVEVIGQIIEPQSRAVEVHAHIIDNNELLRPGMYVNARILTNDKPLFCLPSSAIVKEENEYYIFVKLNDSFIKTAINVGIEEDDYVEVINPTAIKEDTIVINGAYYLNSRNTKE